MSRSVSAFSGVSASAASSASSGAPLLSSVRNQRRKTSNKTIRQPPIALDRLPLEAIPLSKLCLSCSDFIQLTDPRRSPIETLWDIHQPQRRPPRLLRTRWSKFRGELPLKPIYLTGLAAGRACPLCDFFRAMCASCGDETPSVLLESPLSSGPKEGLVDYPYVVEESASQVLGVVIGQLPVVPVFHLSFGKWSLPKHYFPEETSRGLYFMDMNQPVGCVAPRKIGERVDFELVRTWIDFCDRHHTCQTEMVDFPGFKLLNCWTLKVEEWPVGLKRPPFVAVSYVWGPTRKPPSWEEELSSNAIPPLVDDLVRVVTNMGYGHLWIDRCCIPQDNSQVREQQIKRMDVIFSMATVTVISAAGTSPHDGLHGVSQPRPMGRQAAIKVGSRALVQLPTTSITREVEPSVWNSRGWTYQEGVLSRRRLVFTESQCYFQCCSMNCVEWLSMPLEKLPQPAHQKFFPAVKIPRLFPNGKLRRKERKELGRMIEEFVVRSLTFSDDRLDAFHGILSCFESACGGLQHICGIPVWGAESRWGEQASHTNGVVAGLSWICEYQDTPPARVSSFPSWAWVGWDFSGATGTAFSYPFINGSPPECSARGAAKLCWVSEWPDAGRTASITIEPGNKIIERYSLKTGPVRYRPQVLSVSGWWCHLELTPSFETDGALRVLQSPSDERLHTAKRNLSGLARAQRWKRTVYGQYRIRCWFMGLGYCCTKVAPMGGEHYSHREVLVMALVEAGEWSTFERGDVFGAVVSEEVAGSGLDDVARAIGCRFGEFCLV